jgi:hypothetical protein
MPEYLTMCHGGFVPVFQVVRQLENLTNFLGLISFQLIAQRLHISPGLTGINIFSTTAKK